MTTLLAILLFLAVFGAVAFIVKRGDGGAAKHAHIDDDVWEAARSSVEGTPLQPLLTLGKPFDNVPMVWDENSTLHSYIEKKLLGAGGVFGGSVQVFLSVQIGALLVSAVAMFLGFAGIIPLIVAAPIALIFAVAPFGQVDSLAKRRTDEITRTLPEFAELLLMPLNSGLAVIPALEFCSTRVQGPVAQEVRNMLVLIRTRAMTDVEAFAYAGARLATPEAKAFFNALLAAHLEGVRVVANIQAQADGLRTQMYQKRRADAKKLPVKLIMVFGVFFLPLLFIIGGIPAIDAFSRI